MDHDRIATDPKVMLGKPVIRGTRVPVELIVRMVGQGIAEKEILREYPRLTTRVTSQRMRRRCRARH